MSRKRGEKMKNKIRRQEIKSITEVLKRHKKILTAYLYGSAAKGLRARDIDIGLLLDEKFTPNALYTARIAREIEEKTPLKNVDIRILNRHSLRFLNQVLKYGYVLFSRDDKARLSFETGVTDRYIDFKPFYQEYDMRRRERLLA